MRIRGWRGPGRSKSGTFLLLDAAGHACPAPFPGRWTVIESGSFELSVQSFRLGKKFRVLGPGSPIFPRDAGNGQHRGPVSAGGSQDWGQPPPPQQAASPLCSGKLGPGSPGKRSEEEEFFSFPSVAASKVGSLPADAVGLSCVGSPCYLDVRCRDVVRDESWGSSHCRPEGRGLD